MRTIIIFHTLFLLVANFGFAQDQHPFLSEKYNWQLSCVDLDYSYKHNFKMEFAGDTIIDDKTCKIIDNISEKYIYCEYDKQVYGKRFEDTSFVLMYDFNLQVSDTFVYSFLPISENKFHQGYLKVFQVDSIEMLNGEFRKRIKLKTIDPYPQTLCIGYEVIWIDGIGEITNTPFYIYYDCFESHCHLLCFSEDSTYIYGECGPDNNEQHEDLNFKVYPNPFINSVEITNLEELEKVELITLNGELIELKIINQEVFIPNDLKNGLYFLSLTTKKGDKQIIKISKI